MARGHLLMASILFICDTPQAFNGTHADTEGLGGVETTVVSLAEALAQRGHAVTVCTTATAPVTHKHVSWQPMEALVRVAAEVVITCNHASRLDDVHASKHARKIVWLHNPLSLEKAIRKYQFGALLRHRPDVVCVGDALRKRASMLLPFRDRHTIGHGVSAPFLTTPSPPLAARKNHVVWVSQPQRGLRETLALWKSHVWPAVPDAEFHLFGRSLQDCGMTADALTACNIVLHPRATKQQLAEVYAGAKLLFYPGARDETFCLAAAEAQCMGVPVVTRGMGSLAERVTHNTNGLIAKTDDAFAQAAIAVLTDASLWNRLSAGALKQRDALPWQRVAQQWENLINSQSID